MSGLFILLPLNKITTCENGLSPAEPLIFTIEDELPFVPSEICTLVAVCKISCKVVFPDFAISAEVMIVTLPFDFISSVFVLFAVITKVFSTVVSSVNPKEDTNSKTNRIRNILLYKKEIADIHSSSGLY